MAGEQELVNDYILRLAVKGGLQFARNLVQVYLNSRESMEDFIDDEGGLVEYEDLISDHSQLQQLDLSHIKDWDKFEELAIKHKVQFAITSDPNNPEKEYFWFRARDQGQIQAFLQEFLIDAELDLENEPSDNVVDPEDLIKKKKESTKESETAKYRLTEQSFEGNFYEIHHFDNFEDLKAFLSERYDSKLEKLSVDVDTFKDVASIKDLEEIVSKLDESEVKLTVERDGIFKDATKEATNEDSKEDQATEKPLFRVFEPNQESSEIHIREFSTFDELKEYINSSFNDSFEELGITERQFDKIEDFESLEDLINQLKLQEKGFTFKKVEPTKTAQTKSSVHDKKFKLDVYDLKKNERQIMQFSNFSEMKAYLSEHHQAALVSADLGIESFEEISSIKEMNEILTHISDDKLQFHLFRKPLSKEMDEKVQQKNDREKSADKAKEKTTVKDKEHER